jgi:uroporphyrinogen-III synthase
MTSHPSPSVVLFSGPDTLSGVDERLRRRGVRPVRIASWAAEPIDPIVWISRLTRPPGVDTVVVTSRAAVASGVRPWRQVLGRFPPGIEFWAVGPGTARALRAVGVGHVRRPPTVGTNRFVPALRGRRRRTIAYLRSDLAGPRLARALRRDGHRVRDVVVYRATAPDPLTSHDRGELGRARLLVVTSPSGLDHLRAAAGPRDFRRLTESVPLVVLGERSRRTARQLRFGRISIAPGTTPQRFTQFLMRELRHVTS